MRPTPELVFDPTCPTATAVVRVLSALGYRSRPTSDWREAPEFPVLLVHDRTGDRLPLVAPLRLEGFRGPVVVLAGFKRIEIFRRHRVLRYGTDSVAVWFPGLPLLDIVSAVASLPPIGDDVLHEVRSELTIPVDFLTVGVEPCLARLRKTGGDKETLRNLREIVERAVTWSALGSHEKLALGGCTMSVGSHFSRLLGELEFGTTDVDRIADELGAAFSTWQAVALSDTL